MKKNLTYIGILALGLLLGGLIFNPPSIEEQDHIHDQSSETSQTWTCSMHPQIRQAEPGVCPICAMDLTPAANSVEELGPNQFKLTKNAVALANIQTSIVLKGTSGNSSGLNLSGEIQENEDKISVQSAHFDGRIEKLYTSSLGLYINKGQAIAEVYAPELVTAQQELLTAYKVRETQPKLYEAIRNKFKNWNVKEDQLSEIEKTGKVKSQFTIYSYVSGNISDLTVKEGSHIMNGHPILKVANLNTVWAEFDAYESQLASINLGDRIQISSLAHPNEMIDAKITFIDPILDTQTRTAIIRAQISNSNNLLKPGMFVKGVLSLRPNNEEHSLIIPKTAVLWTGKRSVVYVKKDETTPVFEMRNVILGKEIEAFYEIEAGLSENEIVVTNGAFTVDAAAQLQGKKSMMNNN
jgi:Cu(I)/Ag(I) efflux system membrane fusion protein